VGGSKEIELALLSATVVWEATDGGVTRSGWQSTPLIALLELVKIVEER